MTGVQTPQTRTRPRVGQVRDVIRSLIDEAPTALRTDEIIDAVRAQLGDGVPASTVRSCLNLQVGDLWRRVGHGFYAPADREVPTPRTRARSLGVDATIILEDCREAFCRLADNSVDAVVTDPPYFFDKMGDDWDVDGASKVAKSSVVSHLPGGMVFSRDQSRQLEELIEDVARRAFEKVKPGGWFLAFSAPRLVHRMAAGIENAGFEIRDQWGWCYRQSMPKGMSLSRYIGQLDANESLTTAQRTKIAEELEHWKTPQVKSVIEPVVVAQKPREGSFLENWTKWHVGLINFAHRSTDGAAPANLFVIPHDGFRDGHGQLIDTEADAEPWDHHREPGLVLGEAIEVPKPRRRYRSVNGDMKDIAHLSPKPLEIMEHLIELVVPLGGVVCDPFNGSGSTGLAALSCGRNYVGIERERRYFELTRDRFESEFIDTELSLNPGRDDTVLSTRWTVANRFARPSAA